MKKKLFYVLTLMLVTVFALAACGGGDDSANDSGADSGNGENAAAEGETYVFKYGHISSEDNVWQQQAEKFAEELNRLSDGRMEVEFYPMGQLGNENDMIQQLETGTLDFAVITTGQLSNYNEDLNAWSLPFMFESIEDAIEASDSEPARQILDSLEKNGLVGLSYNFVGNRYILMKDTQIESPEDFKGKKIRVTGGPAVQDFWNALEASPEAMPLPEVYTSLQTGVIDGIDIDLGALLEQKLYEVADYLTLTNHYAFAGIDVMSAAVFEKLSEEDQQIVLEAAQIAEEFGGQLTIEEEKAHLQELEAEDVTINDFPYADNFEEIQNDLFEKYSDNDLVKAFIDEYKK